MLQNVMAVQVLVEAEPWYASTVWLLVGFLILGVLVIAAIVAVLWWTRLPK